MGLVYSLKTCQKYNDDGVKCGNSGCEEYVIRESIKVELKKREAELLNFRYQQDTRIIRTLEREIAGYKKDIFQKEEEKEQVKKMYTLKVIGDSELIEKVSDYDKQLVQLKNELRIAEQTLKKESVETHEFRLKRFEEFKKNFDWDTIDISEGNKLLRTIIQKIIYTRNSNEINIVVQYR